MVGFQAGVVESSTFLVLLLASLGNKVFQIKKKEKSCFIFISFYSSFFLRQGLAL
jgi:multisubunit Na+/H+ antiporter MnhB subunit